MAAPIVFATDFSPAAVDAQDWALRLCKQLGAPLVIVHAWELPSMMYGLDAAGAPTGTFLETMGEQAKKALDEHVRELLVEGLEVTGELRYGPAASQVCEVAKERNAQLIICGTHGRGGLGRALMGSVDTRVVHESNRPVLVVPAAKPTR